MLAKATGVELTHVPYKGGTLALQDLLGGQVPASINPIGELLAHVQGDKLRVLATSGAKRCVRPRVRSSPAIRSACSSSPKP